MTEALPRGGRARPRARDLRRAGGGGRRPGAEEVPAHEEVLVLDFGGQYSQLIARRIRECGVFAELLPSTAAVEEIRERAPEGAGPLRRAGLGLRAGGARGSRPSCSTSEIPMLGICYGMQAMVQALGGRVEAAEAGEFGRTELVLRDGGGELLGGPAGRAELLDEPPRRGLRAARGLHRARLQPRLAGGRLRGARPRPLRDPVPPRGRPHALRDRDPHPLPARRRRLRASSGRRSR